MAYKIQTYRIQKIGTRHAACVPAEFDLNRSQGPLFGTKILVAFLTLARPKLERYLQTRHVHSPVSPLLNILACLIFIGTPPQKLLQRHKPNNQTYL